MSSDTYTIPPPPSSDDTPKSTLRRKRRVTPSKTIDHTEQSKENNAETEESPERMDPKLKKSLALEKVSRNVSSSSGGALKKRKRVDSEDASAVTEKGDRKKKQVTLDSLMKKQKKRRVEKEDDALENVEGSDEHDAQMQDMNAESSELHTANSKRKSSTESSGEYADSPLYLEIMRAVKALDTGRKKDRDPSKIINVHGFRLKLTSQTKKMLQNRYSAKTYAAHTKFWSAMNKKFVDGRKSIPVLNHFTGNVLKFPDLPDDKSSKLLILMRFMNALAMVPMERFEALAEGCSMPPSDTKTKAPRPTLEGTWKKLLLLAGNEVMSNVAEYLMCDVNENLSLIEKAELLEKYIISKPEKRKASKSKESKKKTTRTTADKGDRSNTSASNSTVTRGTMKQVEGPPFAVKHHMTRVQPDEATMHRVVMRWSDLQQTELVHSSTPLPEMDLKLFVRTGTGTESKKAFLMETKLSLGNATDIALPVTDRGTKEQSDTPMETVRVAYAGGQILSQDWLPIEEASLSHFAVCAQVTRGSDNPIISKELFQSSFRGGKSQPPIQVWSVDHRSMAMKLRFKIYSGHGIPYSAKWMPLFDCRLEQADGETADKATTTATRTSQRYSPLGVIACAMSDGSLCVYAVPDIQHDAPLDLRMSHSGVLISHLQDEPCIMTAVEWTKEGRRVIAGDQLGHIHVFVCNFEDDSRRLERIIQINAHSDLVRTIACATSNTNLIASGSIDGSLVVTNIMDPTSMLMSNKRLLGWVTALEFANFSNVLFCVDHTKGFYQVPPRSKPRFRTIKEMVVSNPYWDVSVCSSVGCAAFTTSMGSVLLMGCGEPSGEVDPKKQDGLLGTVLETRRDTASGNYTVLLPNMKFTSDVDVSALEDAPDYASNKLVNKDNDKSFLIDVEGQMQHVSFHPSTKASLCSWMLASNHEGLMFLTRLPNHLSAKLSE